MKRPTLASPVVVRHPVSGQYVTISRNQEFADDDPVVDAYGWAFEAPVERATAAPGEKRPVGRPKGSKNKPKEA